MRDTQLYARILGIERPWRVVDVQLDLGAAASRSRLEGGEVDVYVEHGGGKLTCPACGERSPGYDRRERRWRHLDTCQHATILVARVRCAEHGVRQVSMPWAEANSRFNQDRMTSCFNEAAPRRVRRPCRLRRGAR